MKVESLDFDHDTKDLLDARKDDPGLPFMRRCLQNLRLWEVEACITRKGEFEAIHLHDARRADKLLWLARERHPDRKLHCGALGYSRDMVAEWPKVFDGLFFTDENAPSNALRR